VSEAVRVWLLGGFRVSVGSRSIGEQGWRLRKARSLLKVLALSPGHRLHREQAMELLWPDLRQEAALNNLHYALHVARRTLEPSALASSSAASSAASRYLHLWDERLALCPDSPLWVDVDAFEEAAATARHTLEPAAFRAAIDLYAGELLPHDRYEPWVEERRAELQGLYLSLLLEVAALHFKVLTGGRTADPRHRTLRATLEWSHGLLGERERVLLGRLSVFAGGWTLEAAEEVCSGEGIEQGGVLEVLSELVDKSLVAAEAPSSPAAGGALRYRMLEPVRQYGQERLRESGTAERLRERHARHYLALAEGADGEDREEAQPELWEARPAAWLEQMHSEQGNLRAALDWSLDEDAEQPDGARAELGLRLAVALFWFWHTHGYLTEGRRYLQRALPGRGDPTTTRLRARALQGVGTLANSQGDHGAAKALTEEGLALYRELGDEEGIAAALTYLLTVAVMGQRDDIPVGAVLEELGELKPRLRNRNTLAYLHLGEGMVALSRGDLEHSLALHEQGLKLFREIQDTPGITNCLGNLGGFALVRGDYEGAVPLLREALRLAWESDYKWMIQLWIYLLACVAASWEQPVRAARLWGAVEGMEEAYGLQISPMALSLADYEGRLSLARSQLGEEAWSGAWAEGKAMALERAIEYALSEEEERDAPTLVAVPEQQPPPLADEPTERLTAREQEVALLVGRGLTNRQIALELSISERTVENHIGKILKKLGFSSRARIAAWVAQR
jgi:non-specific serine/threonine protein kinase